ncbi:MAG: hypothetical protein N3F66_04965 [Spirochaetes bacterium]|nr:hypothetical protein [Spirochaetota bacterium]
MDDIKKINELILQRLQQPFIADNNALHFIESSLGLFPEQISESILEEYGIIDLIVVPDEQFRKIIEPYIPAKGIPEENVNEIVFGIERYITYISLHIAGQVITYSDPSVYKTFVTKLYLPKENIPIPNNQQLLNKYITARIAVRLYAKIENLQIIKRLIDNLVFENDESLLYDCIKLFSHIVYDTADIYTALSVQKQRLQKQLLEMYEFKQLMQVYSMEFLMSVRRNVPLTDQRSLLYQITLIDTICTALFGIPAKGFVHDLEFEINDYTINQLFNRL